MSSTNNSILIKNKARDLGFMLCGISKAEPLKKEALFLEKWLNQNKHGEMKWMENYFDLRVDPTKLFPGAKTIISLALNYFPEETQSENDTFKVSKYAYGKDYHFIIKEKLRYLLDYIHQEIGEVSGRAFVDSAPIMDKVWAKKSGVGWMGKNTNIINPKAGSFFFLGELVLDIDLTPDGPIKDYCGTCTKCIDSCPTEALSGDFGIDGSKCISYFTIELKDELPLSFSNKFENWMFGCDICQDVCPWNRFSKPTKEEWFKPHDKLLTLEKSEWKEISLELFQEIFRKSAVKRTKYSGLKRNIEFLSQNLKTDS
ncbi:MAG: tRNA epoxyqueuosine(34) reductase QueG [Salibacteraceae bacterium]